MKQRHASPAASITKQVLHGHFNFRMPGLCPYVSTMAYAVDGPSGPMIIYNQRTSVLRYFRTPSAVRMDRPGARWLDIPAGSALLMPFGARYRLDMGRPGSQPSHVWMSMHWMEDSALGPMVQNRLGFALILDPKRLLWKEFEAILSLIHEIKKTHEAFWPAQHLGARVVAAASRAVRVANGIYRLDDGECKSKPDPLISRVMACLHRHIGASITIPDIARELSTSPSTVAHRYRAATGETPMHTLRRMRIEEAKSLLSQGAAIGDVALRLGFCDAHHLARNFKRLEGLTPSAFRQLAIPPGNRETD